jgi:hypothetical protein
MWPTYTTNQLLARLTALNALNYGGAPLGSELALYINDVTPDANSVLASFEEPDFEGYERVPLTMTPPSLNDSLIPVSQSNLCTFRPTSLGEAFVAYGVLVVKSGLIVAGQRFDIPINMGSTTQAINGVWRTSEPLSNYGWLSVE